MPEFSQLPLDIIQDVAEHLTTHTKDLARLSLCSRSLRKAVKPTLFRDIKIKPLTLSTLEHCIQDIEDVLPSVHTLNLTGFFESGEPNTGIQDDLLEAYHRFLPRLPALLKVTVSVFIDDSEAFTEQPVHRLPFWPRLATLLQIVNRQSQGRVKPSLHINFPSPHLHLERRVLQHLVQYFKLTGPLNFKVSATCVDWETENDVMYEPGTDSLTWPDNLQPFSLQCWQDWDILTAALDVPITHLEIGYLRDVHENTSNSISWPHLVDLKINDCFDFPELFRYLVAERLVNLAIRMQEAASPDLVEAYRVIAGRCRAIKSFKFDMECPCENVEVVHERARHLHDLAEISLEHDIVFRVTLRFTPYLHEHHIHPFQSWKIVSPVKQYIEDVLMEIDPHVANGVVLPIPDFTHVETVTIHFIGDLDAINEDGTLPRYLSPICDSKVHTLSLRIPPLDPPALRTLIDYLEEIPTLRNLEIQRLSPSGGQTWQDIEDVQRHIEEMQGWMEVARICHRRDIAFTYTAM